jgi:CRP-like cAMP-binding protein
MAKTIQELGELEAILPATSFAADSVIFREGETGEYAYVVAGGEVIICTRNRDGELVHLTTLKRGQLFGELALLNEHKRTATAITETGCDVLILRPSFMRQKYSQGDPIMRFWIDYLAERVIDLSKRIGPADPARTS